VNRRTDNIMARRKRTDNIMARRKRTNKDIQNTTQLTFFVLQLLIKLYI